MTQSIKPQMERHKAPVDAKVLITGLIRDGAHCIEREIEKLMTSAKIFKDVNVLIIESDSKDATLDQLAKQAARDPKVKYLSLGQLKDSLPERTVRLACCRNAYLSELRDNPLYTDVDYVIVADLDGMNDLLTSASLASCWNVAEDWDVITANQDGPYYDIWPLRHPDWSPDDCLALLARLEPLFGHELARDIAVYARQIRIPRNTPLIPVQSAFGGLAIYRRTALLSGRYAGCNEQGQEVSEHVPLHQQLVQAGHAIYINPKLINTGLTIHTRNKRTSKVIRNAIKAHFMR